MLLDLYRCWAEGPSGCPLCVLVQVLVRATGRVVELDQCGIQPTKLFALYDQVGRAVRAHHRKEGLPRARSRLHDHCPIAGGPASQAVD